MGIWIRSQDKCTLINVNKIQIADVRDIHKNAIWGNDVLLGKYSTKQKALKVLEDIQLALIYSDVVVKMPQDNEVE